MVGPALKAERCDRVFDDVLEHQDSPLTALNTFVQASKKSDDLIVSSREYVLRFSVSSENAADFEALWLGRDSQLKGMYGFVEFHMLKGPEVDGMTLYAPHIVWASDEAFTAWTHSAAFREAHRNAGSTRKLHEGAPKFEGFSAIQHLK